MATTFSLRNTRRIRATSCVSRSSMNLASASLQSCTDPRCSPHNTALLNGHSGCRQRWRCAWGGRSALAWTLVLTQSQTKREALTAAPECGTETEVVGHAGFGPNRQRVWTVAPNPKATPAAPFRLKLPLQEVQLTTRLGRSVPLNSKSGYTSCSRTKYTSRNWPLKEGSLTLATA